MDKILNFETLLPRLENDESLVKEILLLYIDTTPGQIDTLKTALQEKKIISRDQNHFFPYFWGSMENWKF
jgi:hypothetical protein